MMRDMKRHLPRRFYALSLLLLTFLGSELLAEPTPSVISAFDAYSRVVEARLAHQHRSPDGFLAPENDDRLRSGEVVVEQMADPATPDLSDALLHHWRGSAFVAGATAADFDRLLRDFNGYPRYFSPQVLQASILSQAGDHMQAKMRVRQQHVITVVMDSTYDIVFGRLDFRHGYSTSRSIRITEIAGAGTTAEHTLDADHEHGFLWRINTYWSYEERDGGLYLQVESVSLSRAIPRGLGWAVRPFVGSVPRESIDFTLRSATRALHK
jgi:hypothetical protein